MKTPIVKIAALTVFIGSMLVNCNNSPKAKEDQLSEAKEEVIDAKADLAESERDSIHDFNIYKESMEKKLAENEKVIADLKSKNTSTDKKVHDLYVKELASLEMKNAECKSKIMNYKQGTEQKWELFKVDFNKGVDELGQSISEMAQRNMKK